MSAGRTCKGAGFTLLELLIAAMLSIGLMLIAGQFWGYFSRQLSDINARARAAQELRFAVSSITQDMGPAVGAVPVGSDGVLLCKDGGDANGLPEWAEPDGLVSYSLVGGQLVRQDQSSGVSIVVADNVSVFAVEDVSPTVLRMTIAIQRADITRQVSLLWSRP